MDFNTDAGGCFNELVVVPTLSKLSNWACAKEASETGKF
jgi:hypothetical protein